MDPRTALLVAFLMIMANGCVLGLVRRHLWASMQPAAARWQMGTFIVAAGCLSFMFSGQFPPALSLPLSNGLIMMGMAAYWHALRLYYGKPPKKAIANLAVLAGVASNVWFNIAYPSPEWRIYIASAVWIVLLAGSITTLRAHAAQDASRSSRALTGIFLLIALFTALRALYYVNASLPVNFSVLNNADLMNRLTPMLAVSLPIIGTTAFLLMCYDRMRQKSAEEAEHSRQSSRHKSEAISYLGHDLRAPLASIVGHIRLLRESGTPEQASHLLAIERSAGYQLALIDEILDFARHELRPLEIRLRPVSLLDLLDDVVLHADILSRQQDNAFAFTADTPLPASITTDGRRLRQALLNLVSNAAKFTRKGTIRLTASADTQNGRHMLRFSVTDSGIGIDPAAHLSVFKPFEQAAPETGGAGLGLYIVQNIVQNLGGELRLQSALGTGSCFSFAIPARPLTDETITPRFDTPAPAAPAPRPAPTECLAAGIPGGQLDELASLSRQGQLSDIESWLESHAQAHPDNERFFHELGEALQRLDFQRIESLAQSGSA